MRTYRATTGPFSERPYYQPEEVELMCYDELRKVRLYPSKPEPVRVDRFVEKRFKIHLRYEELPAGVLGLIEFGLDGVRGIAVSKGLLEEGSQVANRRINTTIAHEAGHGLLHTAFFVLNQNADELLKDEFGVSKNKKLCRGNSIEGVEPIKQGRHKYSPLEYQANMVIGPLLLPSALVKSVMEQYTITLEGLHNSEKDFKECVRVLSEVFDVNPVVAEIRLKVMCGYGK